MSSPAQRLMERIQAQGAIPFADLMAEALYGEGGYYTGQRSPIGTDGDYVTGSALSPLFGQATAQLVRRLDQALGSPADVLEVGYGGGDHLRSLLADLGEDSGRRILALDRVSRPLPEGIEVLESLEALSSRSFRGLIFSYELFDAFPVHRLVGMSDQEVGELWVNLDTDGRFCFVVGPLSNPDLLRCLGPGKAVLAPGQIADVTQEWGRLYRRLADLLDWGLLVTCDYGFDRRRLLDKRVRFHGTLACYRKQRVHRDALSHVGDQDLTAHVDFTTLIDTGEAAGLETVAFTRQARWLVACGLFDRLQRADQGIRLQAMDLLSADGMGEEIRVLIQKAGLETESVLDRELLGGMGTGKRLSERGSVDRRRPS